jgi:hypothetical protein
MKKAVNTLHVVAAFIPFSFTVSILILFFAESIRSGYSVNPIMDEARTSVLRSISISLMLVGFICIAISIFLGFVRLFIWKENKPTAKFIIFASLSIASMIIMIYLNPFHLFTWMMG